MYSNITVRSHPAEGKYGWHMRHFRVPLVDLTVQLGRVHRARHGNEAWDGILAHYWYRILYGFKGKNNPTPEDVVDFPTPDLPPTPSGPINSMLIDRTNPSARRFVPQLSMYPSGQQERYIRDYASTGLTDIDLYIALNRDNPFNEPYWFIDITRAEHRTLIRDCVQRCRAQGLRVTGWFFSDNLSTPQVTVPDAQRYIRLALENFGEDLSRVVVGIEAQETWRPDPEIFELTRTIRDNTDLPYYVHWGGGMNFGTTLDHFPARIGAEDRILDTILHVPSGVAGIYYQYNSRTPDGVRAETRSMSGKWRDAGKQFIAGEFWWNMSFNDARRLRRAVDDMVNGVADG